MATSLIKINGGVGGESNVDLTLGVPVTLSNDDDTGVTSWRWSLVSKPKNSTASLSTPTSSTSGFTPDLSGSYLIKLMVNDRISNRIIAAVKSVIGLRIPAREEADEYQGWGQAIADNFSVIENSLGGAGIHDLAGAFHNADTLSNLNSKISGGDLDFNSASRPPLGPAGVGGGNLSGTYPNPTVVGITETFGPTELSFSTIQDQQWLKRVGTNVQGVYQPTPLPRLLWSSVTSVNVIAMRGSGYPAYITLRQDGKQRSISSPLTFDISGPVGDGGLDAGVEANSTWYYLYLVPSSGDDNLLTVVGSTSEPSIGPTGHSNHQYVGPVYNDVSGDIRSFYQINNSEFAYNVWFETVGSQALIKTQTYDGAQALLVSLSDVAPPMTGSVANIKASMVKNNVTSFTMSMEIFEESNLDQVTVSPNTSTSSLGRITTNVNADDIAEGSFRVPVYGSTPSHGLRILIGGGAVLPSNFAIHGLGFVDGYL